MQGSEDLLDILASMFALHVRTEFEQLRKRYDVPTTYDIGVACNHVDSAMTVINFRITAGVTTVRRRFEMNCLDTVHASEKQMNEAIMAICRTFAQQYPREKHA